MWIDGEGWKSANLSFKNVIWTPAGMEGPTNLWQIKSPIVNLIAIQFGIETYSYRYNILKPFYHVWAVFQMKNANPMNLFFHSFSQQQYSLWRQRIVRSSKAKNVSPLEKKQNIQQHKHTWRQAHSHITTHSVAIFWFKSVGRFQMMAKFVLG